MTYQPSEQLDPVQQAYQRKYWTVRILLFAALLIGVTLWLVM